MVDCTLALDPVTCAALVEEARAAHDDLMVLIGAMLGAGFLPFLIRQLFGSRGT